MMADVPLVVLCIGPERWLREQAIARLKAEGVAPGFEETDVTRFSEPPETPQTILEAIRTAPFGSSAAGSSRRLVVLEGLETIQEKSVPWLKAYLQQPNPTSCVVLCAEKAGEERLLAGSRSAAAAVRVVACHPLAGAALRDWVMDQARDLGKTMEPKAAGLLIGRCGTGLMALRWAVESLSLLIGTSDCVAVSDVEALWAPSLRETAFGILDAAGAGRAQEALAALREGLASGNLAPEQVLGALGWYYRMIWKVRHRAPAGGAWTSPSRKEALHRLARWPRRRVARALEEALQADAALKTGAPHPELLLDQLLLKLAGQN